MLTHLQLFLAPRLQPLLDDHTGAGTPTRGGVHCELLLQGLRRHVAALGRRRSLRRMEEAAVRSMALGAVSAVAAVLWGVLEGASEALAPNAVLTGGSAMLLPRRDSMMPISCLKWGP